MNAAGALRHSSRHRRAVQKLRSRFPVMEWRTIHFTREDHVRLAEMDITPRQLFEHLYRTCGAREMEEDAMLRSLRVLMPRHEKVRLP